MLLCAETKGKPKSDTKQKNAASTSKVASEAKGANTQGTTNEPPPDSAQDTAPQVISDAQVDTVSTPTTAVAQTSMTPSLTLAATTAAGTDYSTVLNDFASATMEAAVAES